MFRALGADTGFDMNDFALPDARCFLKRYGRMTHCRNRALLLNPGDNPMLASMAGTLLRHPPGVAQSAVRYRMVVQRSQIRHGIPACDAFSIGMLSTLHWHAD